MIEMIIQCSLSNTAIALSLAIVACIVGALTNRTHLAYGLWLLVLIKLITPPLWNVPMELHLSDNLLASRPLTQSNIEPIEPTASQTTVASVEDSPSPKLATQATSRFDWESFTLALAATWFVGFGATLVFSLMRACRFNRLLVSTLSKASPVVHLIAANLQPELRIKTMPELTVTSAKISPFVWWMGGKVQVVLPQKLIDELNPNQLSCVIAHELSHVSRKDHVVRWIEWLSCVCCWWNPIAWWARRSLRASEEVCCDSLAMSSLRLDSRTYANSILTAIESLATPDLSPPVMASEINSGGFMKRRIEKIMTNSIENSKSSVRKVILFCIAIAIIPLGLAQAQQSNHSYDKVSKRLLRSVKKGEITKVQFDAMMNVLRESKQPLNLDDWKYFRDFSNQSTVLSSTINRAKNAAIEVEHFKRLDNAGIDTLDVALDAQRRQYQSRIKLNSALVNFASAYKELKSQIQSAIDNGELSRDLAIKLLAEVESEYKNIRSRLDPVELPVTGENSVWLASKNANEAVNARAAALATWNTIKEQFENGTNVTIQQVAQASEQYHFFAAQVVEAQYNLSVRELRAKKKSE
jgi:beta-lactamase regulating signal transducer with metallopeptidase domain